MGRYSRGRSPAPLALVAALLVGVGGSLGVLRAADETESAVRRVEGLDEFLTKEAGPSENFLLVGSDSREGSLEAADETSRRSDTIMILRREKGGGAALLSIPRDLWVAIPGQGEGKINAAYNGGPELLARTVTESLGIPIKHYVEIDFNGFKKMVDTIGGVEICVLYATKDVGSGLNLQPGCHQLNGETALQYARSRKYEEFIDGEWRLDPRADLGRIERQQNFIRIAVDRALGQMENDPFASGRLIDAVVASVRIDEAIEPVDAAKSLRAAAQDGLQTVQLPVEGGVIGDQAVVTMVDGAEQILDYFRGKGELPASATTTTTTN
ncbi:MAG: LCP family protein [Acidimicrobiia bacterium]|nr:LCP family protein [Acidimicrobiia bacterium]